MQHACLKLFLIKRFLAIFAFGVIANIVLLTIGSLSFASTKPNDENINVRSFSGAYLAGNLADYENHLSLSVDFYKKALNFAPDNIETRYDYLIALLSTGDFKQALAQANILKGRMNDKFNVSLTLASDAFIKKNYLLAINRLEFENPTDIDRIILLTLKSWAYIGRNKNEEAIHNLEKIKGPLWYDLFISYHLALLNDLSGNIDEAEQYYLQALKYQRGQDFNANYYERIIINYAAFALKNNNRVKAIHILKEGERALSDNTVLQNIRKKVENGGNIETSVKTPQEGAAEILANIGVFIEQEGVKSYTIIYLQLANAIAKNNSAIVFQLGKVTKNLKQYDQSNAFFSAIDKKSVYWKEGFFRKSITLAEQGQKTVAINNFNTLLKQHYNENNVSYSLAMVYMLEKDYEKTIEVLTQRISNTPPAEIEWYIIFQRGAAYERMKNWEKAELDLRQALKLNPNSPAILNYLGYSLIDRNEKLDEALQMLMKAAAMNPYDGYVIDSLGWAYYKLGRYDEAINLLENAVKRHPGDMTLNDHLGDAYWQVGRKIEAGFQWNHAIAAKPEPEDLARIEDKLKNGLQAASNNKPKHAENMQKMP